MKRGIVFEGYSITWSEIVCFKSSFSDDTYVWSNIPIQTTRDMLELRNKCLTKYCSELGIIDI